MSMTIGLMDQRIGIFDVQATTNEFGEQIEVLAKLFDAWAEKRDMRGTERFTAQQVVGGAETKFRMRYRSNMNTKHKIVHREKEYDIVGILEIGRKEGLEIHAKSRAD